MNRDKKGSADMTELSKKYGEKAQEVLNDVINFFRNQREEAVKKYIGKRAIIEIQGLHIDVVVKDVKVTFKGTEFQVTPLNGSKSTWVSKIIM